MSWRCLSKARLKSSQHGYRDLGVTTFLKRSSNNVALASDAFLAFDDEAFQPEVMPGGPSVPNPIASLPAHPVLMSQSWGARVRDECRRNSRRASRHSFVLDSHEVSRCYLCPFSLIRVSRRSVTGSRLLDMVSSCPTGMPLGSDDRSNGCSRNEEDRSRVRLP